MLAPVTPDAPFEATLRRYLAYLEDESALVDEERVRELNEAIDVTSDPIERLRLLSELERASHGADAGELEGAVASGLRAWAEANAVTRGALEQVGVPASLLDRAGMGSRGRARNGERSRRRSSRRAPRLSADEVKAAITSQLGKTWKLSELATAIDREPATTRNYVARLVEEGWVTEVGDDPAHDGRGRAPKLYSRAV
jgi:hypothetical protein